MRQTVERELDHPSLGLRVYRIEQIKFEASKRLEAELLRVAGPALGQVLGGIDLLAPGEIGVLQSVLTSGAAGFVRLAQTMTVAELNLFEREMFSCVSSKLQPDDPAWANIGSFANKELYETLFAGDGRTHYYQLLGACLEHNFASFLELAKPLLADLEKRGKTMMTQASRSPKDSETAGTPGAS